MSEQVLELSVSPNYVPNWGVWEALRELLQNAMDAEQQGHPMEVRYRKDRNAIAIMSHGASIPRSSLLLGVSSKTADTTQRGQFGEGYKLALTVLSRMGRKVVVLNNGERWAPSIEQSDTYGDRVLKVRITPASTDIANTALTFIVSNIKPEEYDQLCARRISPQEGLPTSQGRILTDPKHRNKVYAKELFVRDLADNYQYGYNLTTLKLDRDRKMVDSWSFTQSVGRALEDALLSDQIPVDDFMNLLSGDVGEAHALHQYYKYNANASSAIADKLAEAFLAQHGENAVPVTSTAASHEAAHMGLRGIPVTPVVALLLEDAIGDLQSRKLRHEATVIKRYGLQDLSEEESKVFYWVMKLTPDVPTTIVDFQGDLDGKFLENEICVARRLLSDPAEALATVVHEYCHHVGADGSVEHERAIERMLSKIAVQWIP